MIFLQIQIKCGVRSSSSPKRLDETDRVREEKNEMEKENRRAEEENRQAEKDKRAKKLAERKGGAQSKTTETSELPAQYLKLCPESGRGGKAKAREFGSEE